MAVNSDLYALLGVSESASVQEITRAWRRESLKHHPDKNSGNEKALTKFHELQDALAVLSDTNKRAEYDKKRTAELQKKRRHDAFSMERRSMATDLEERESKRRSPAAFDNINIDPEKLNQLAQEGAKLRHQALLKRQRQQQAATDDHPTPASRHQKPSCHDIPITTNSNTHTPTFPHGNKLVYSPKSPFARLNRHRDDYPQLTLSRLRSAHSTR